MDRSPDCNRPALTDGTGSRHLGQLFFRHEFAYEVDPGFEAYTLNLFQFGYPQSLAQEIHAADEISNHESVFGHVIVCFCNFAGIDSRPGDQSHLLRCWRQWNCWSESLTRARMRCARLLPVFSAVVQGISNLCRRCYVLPPRYVEKTRLSPRGDNFVTNASKPPPNWGCTALKVGKSDASVLPVR